MLVFIIIKLWKKQAPKISNSSARSSLLSK
jgi:hypothetical protein